MNSHYGVYSVAWLFLEKNLNKGRLSDFKVPSSSPILKPATQAALKLFDNAKAAILVVEFTMFTSSENR